eukprot:tig00001029_g6407.t1
MASNDEILVLLGNINEKLNSVTTSQQATQSKMTQLDSKMTQLESKVENVQKAVEEDAVCPATPPPLYFARVCS